MVCPLYAVQVDRYPLCRRLIGPPGPFWTGAENLASTGIRSLHRSVLSESLYRLGCPGPSRKVKGTTILGRAKVYSSKNDA